MMQDHRRIELAGPFSHPLSTHLLGSVSVCRLPASVDEEEKVVAPQDNDSLGTNLEQVRAQVLHVDE